MSAESANAFAAGSFPLCIINRGSEVVVIEEPTVSEASEVSDFDMTEIDLEDEEFYVWEDEELGPYDVGDLEEGFDPVVGAQWHRLDFGSFLLPVPTGFGLQVEMLPGGEPAAAHLTDTRGRITVSLFSAPKSGGQWRSIVRELQESLESQQATVEVERGPWGPELYALTPQTDIRFIGVDGPRWMVRCVLVGVHGQNQITADSELTVIAREVLSDTIIQRGDEPYPARSPLPLTLPDQIQGQIQEAQRQAAQQAEQQQSIDE